MLKEREDGERTKETKAKGQNGVVYWKEEERV